MIVIVLLLFLTVCVWGGWSAVHDCGISWPDSLIILVKSCNGLYIFKSVLFAEIHIESSGLNFCHKYLLPIVVY